MAKLRSLHALDKVERECTQHIAALPPSKGNITEAFKKFYPRKVEEILKVAKEKKSQGKKTQPIQAVYNEAARWFRQEKIQEYYRELLDMDSDSARRVLLEKAVIDGSESAANRVIEQENALKFRDDVDNFWLVTADCDAIYKRIVECPHCQGEITLELEVRELLGETDEDPELLN